MPYEQCVQILLRSAKNQGALFQEMLQVDGDEIDVLNTPTEFYDNLRSGIARSKKRVVLSALYLSGGELESQLISDLDAALEREPELNVTFIFDHSRSMREQGGKTNISVLNPLIEKYGVNRVNTFLYLMPQLRKPVIEKFVPGLLRELLAVYHAKFYIFDDDVLLSGANMSSEYFTNRQDRYILFRNEKQLQLQREKEEKAGKDGGKVKEVKGNEFLPFLLRFCENLQPHCHKVLEHGQVRPPLCIDPSSLLQALKNANTNTSTSTKNGDSNSQNGDSDSDSASGIAMGENKNGLNGVNGKGGEGLCSHSVKDHSDNFHSVHSDSLLLPIFQHPGLGLLDESRVLPTLVRGLCSLITVPTIPTTPTTPTSTPTSSSSSSSTSSSSKSGLRDFVLTSAYPSLRHPLLQSLADLASKMSDVNVSLSMNIEGEGDEGKRKGNGEGEGELKVEGAMKNLGVRVVTPSDSSHAFASDKKTKSMVPVLHREAYVSELNKGGHRVHGKGAIQQWLYQRQAWTYHSKGIWAGTYGGDTNTNAHANANADAELTYIGSSNLGSRGHARDLELGFVLLTRNAAARTQLQAERRRLLQFCTPDPNFLKNTKGLGLGLGQGLEKGKGGRMRMGERLFMRTITRVLRTYL